MYKGSCLCGAVTYQATQELSDFGYCHCRSCQKASGSAHAANAGVERRYFELHDPEELVREFESSAGKFRTFCSRCGSPLYAYLAKTPDLIRIRLGSLDTAFTKKPRAHTFVKQKAPWHAISDGLPQFDEWASKDVLIQRGSRQP